MVQGYMLLGYEATLTGSEVQHVTDRNTLPPCSRVLWYDRNSSAELDKTANTLCQKLGDDINNNTDTSL
jgi:hypothetical protein